MLHRHVRGRAEGNVAPLSVADSSCTISPRTKIPLWNTCLEGVLYFQKLVVLMVQKPKREERKAHLRNAKRGGKGGKKKNGRRRRGGPFPAC